MKFAATQFLASIGSASAFLAPATKSTCLPLHMADDRRTSESLPFMKSPVFLDGSMAGDAGFDPLGFADSSQNLKYYREAEIKHARLAMLAAAGWPLSELWDKKIAGLLGMEAVLDEANRVPSVLNGGMEKISPVYWGVCLALASAIDVYGLSRASKPKSGYIPGDFGFDPLGFYPKDEAGKKKMQTKELKNGRLAMVAITAFALQEFISEVAIVDQVPFFFKPINEVLFNAANDGYTIPADVSYPAVEAASTSAADAFSAATMEAATVAPAASVEAAASVSPVDAVDAISAVTEQAAPIIPPVESVSAASLEAVTTTPPTVSAAVPIDESELVAAKQRIVELEAKLAQIGQLSN